MGTTPFMLSSAIWRGHAGLVRSRTVQRIVEVCVQEWVRFGHTILVGNRIVHRGAKETQRGFHQRVGDYWRGGAGHKFDGKDTEEYWSSTFICWVMRRAGLLEGEFPSTRRHSLYIHRALQSATLPDGGAVFQGRRLGDYAPKVGDLVCYSRSSWMNGYDKARSHEKYSAHGDIVIHVERPRHIWTIGGNVGDSVGLRILNTDARGRLDPKLNPTSAWFCAIENHLPRQ